MKVTPASSGESVWDYPRPPRLEPSGRRIRVVVGPRALVDCRTCFRVLETSHPPTYYIPPAEVRAALIPSARRSLCEWKGVARYWTVRVDDRELVDAAWSYPKPTAPFVAIRDYLAFYPGRVDACFVDDERVTVQEGDFYGGWITSEIRGPFKGAPGTRGW
jgi:uncharacterized protein (DUF427 family)